jgi:carbon-monoxide dehydrogenase medium subunit
MRLWEHYKRPDNLADALNALHDAAGPAAIIAGGTDLLLELEQGRHAAVDTLVDVGDVREMLEIRETDNWIQVGAAVPLREVIEHPLIQSHATCLVEACGLIGGPQVRNVATLGGNVAHALPAGDGIIALLALGAEAEIATQERDRWLAMEDLFAGPGEPTFDRSREILVRFRFPRNTAPAASAFRRIMRPQGVAIAILNMAAAVSFSENATITDIRLAIGPAGPRPLRARATEEALRGRSLDEPAFEDALAALGREVNLRTSPHRATETYRQHLLGNLLRRTLAAAGAAL